MARKPDGAAARTEFLRVRLTGGGMDRIDEMRKARGESRSTYVRRLIEEDYRRNEAK